MWVVARLTAAWRLLAASRRGSTCSECVDPAHTANPTTTATSATAAADGIRTPGMPRTTHPAATPAATATGQPTHGRPPPERRQARGEGTHRDDPQGRADGEGREEAAPHDPRLAMCSMMPVVDTDGVRGR